MPTEARSMFAELSELLQKSAAFVDEGKKNAATVAVGLSLRQVARCIDYLVDHSHEQSPENDAPVAWQLRNKHKGDLLLVKSASQARELAEPAKDWEVTPLFHPSALEPRPVGLVWSCIHHHQDGVFTMKEWRAWDLLGGYFCITSAFHVRPGEDKAFKLVHPSLPYALNFENLNQAQEAAQDQFDRCIRQACGF